MNHRYNSFLIDFRQKHHLSPIRNGGEGEKIAFVRPERFGGCRVGAVSRCALIALPLLFLLTLSWTANANEIDGTGEKAVIVSGQFTHSAEQRATVSGAPLDEAEAFHKEIYG